MSKEAEALRARADALEAAAKVDAIKKRCFFQGYEWDRKGRCFAVYTEFVECPGDGSYPHHETKMDEYGSWDSCHTCNGSGQIFKRHRITAPKYDAPRPPKGAPK